jgi:hypothetical protein
MKRSIWTWVGAWVVVWAIACSEHGSDTGGSPSSDSGGSSGQTASDGTSQTVASGGKSGGGAGAIAKGGAGATSATGGAAGRGTAGVGNGGGSQASAGAGAGGSAGSSSSAGGPGADPDCADGTSSSGAPCCAHWTGDPLSGELPTCPGSSKPHSESSCADYCACWFDNGHCSAYAGALDGKHPGPATSNVYWSPGECLAACATFDAGELDYKAYRVDNNDFHCEDAAPAGLCE